MVLVVLASLLLALTPVFAPAGGAGCHDVVVLGLRGSGQSGLGEQVASVATAVVDVTSALGASVEVVALEYPAISVSDSFGLVLFNGAYDRSVLEGVQALDGALGDLTATCPATEVVVIGYSQGAEVIKRAVLGSLPEHRIAAVVLLADPTRDPEQVLVRLGDPTVERPGAFGAVPLPDHVRAVAVDVCATGDGVCERGRRDLTAHIDGYEGAGEWVAPTVTRLLRDRVTWFGPR